MKTIALKPYESVIQKITEIIDAVLANPTGPAEMLPSLGELDVYREASDSVREIQALIERLPQ